MRKGCGGDWFWWPSIGWFFFGGGGWRSGDIPGSHGVGLWKFIYIGWQSFKSHFRFDPGEGSKVRFWDDVWCGDRPLKIEFPTLFNIASFKEAFIADNVE